MTVEDGRIGRAEWKILGIGLALAIAVYAIPITRFAFSALITLFHELGHAIAGWLLGHPSLPAFDFVYGGGFTHRGEFRPMIAAAIGLGFAYLLWLFRENKRAMGLIGAIAALWLVIVTKEWRREIAIAAAGHVWEFILAALFFYKALAGAGWKHPAVERPLGAFVAFFVQIHSTLFAWRLISDGDFLALYREGKGGALMNDLEVIALDLNIHLAFNPEIIGVARMLLLFSVLPTAVALLWYFERARWHRVLRALRTAETVLVLVIASVAFADEPMCGTGEERDLLARLHHERAPSRIAAHAVPLPAIVRDGAFYLRADEAVAGGARYFDLEGQSLRFEPRGGSKFAVTRTALRYEDPGAMLHDFASRSGTPWHFVTYDLGTFAFPIFGRSVTRVYLTAFNEIELAEPVEEGAASFNDLEAAVHRNAVLSPLMITTRKPRQLAYPQLFVRETADALIVTWRSTAGETFGYDVQAALHRDGSVVYSYQSMRNMRWGTPLLSPGFDPAGGTPRRALHTTNAGAGSAPQLGSLGPMLDIRRIDVSRVAESDLIAVRLTFGAPLDASKLADGQTLRYAVLLNGAPTYVDVTRTGWTVLPLGGIASVPKGAAAQLSGDTIEFYFLQPADVVQTPMRAFTQLRPTTADIVNFTPVFGAPPRFTGADLSALNHEVTTPIAETFVLPALDVHEVWRRIQPAFAISQHDIDAVAIYQNFYTDMIFYAGAYATLGNPAVSGIAPSSPSYGAGIRRSPTLLHMNHFTYNYNAAVETASQVILHEFGHRWLYFFRILEGGAVTNALNPVSAHPAAYVHTPAAFPVFREHESSVMGGAVYSQESANSYRTRVSARGYSWTDLYLMGLAAREEVMPWFYLAGTTLRGEYWPDDNVVVTGEKRPVMLDQIIAVHGERNPTPSLAQKKFRVLFVLVTEHEPADADVAKLNEWRDLLEQTFYLATGGRGIVETEYVRPAKKRALR